MSSIAMDVSIRFQALAHLSAGMFDSAPERSAAYPPMKANARLVVEGFLVTGTYIGREQSGDIKVAAADATEALAESPPSPYGSGCGISPSAISCVQIPADGVAALHD